MISKKQTIRKITIEIYFSNFSRTRKEVRLQVSEIGLHRYLKINTKLSLFYTSSVEVA